MFPYLPRLPEAQNEVPSTIHSQLSASELDRVKREVETLTLEEMVEGRHVARVIDREKTRASH